MQKVFVARAVFEPAGDEIELALRFDHVAVNREHLVKHRLFAFGAGVLFHIAGDGLFAEEQRAHGGRKLFRQQPEQRGFSGAVDADEADLVFRSDVERDAGKQRALAEGHGETAGG